MHAMPAHRAGESSVMQATQDGLVMHGRKETHMQQTMIARV